MTWNIVCSTRAANSPALRESLPFGHSFSLSPAMHIESPASRTSVQWKLKYLQHHNFTKGRKFAGPVNFFVLFLFFFCFVLFCLLVTFFSEVKTEEFEECKILSFVFLRQAILKSWQLWLNTFKYFWHMCIFWWSSYKFWSLKIPMYFCSFLTIYTLINIIPNVYFGQHASHNTQIHWTKPI